MQYIRSLDAAMQAASPLMGDVMLKATIHDRRRAATARQTSFAALAAALLMLSAPPLWGQEEEDLDVLSLEDLAGMQIEVATGTLQLISKAPAVASVITAEDIEAMGAMDLAEVLESVPGLHVVPSRDGSLDPIYSIRGIHSLTNAQVLMLINGVPITQLLDGGRALGFLMPVTSIARVEVLRGPGSAVYGADAFGGVINVITKTGEDIDGTEVGLRFGSFETGNAWVQHGGTWGGWDVAISLEWLHTDGDDQRIVGSDTQSIFDSVVGTSASSAPGPLETRNEVFDVHLSLARERWQLRFWHWRNQDRGVGAGAAQALDPAGAVDSRQTLFDLGYRDADSVQDWDLSGHLSTFFIDQGADFSIFPPGTVLPIDEEGLVSFAPGALPILFPDGFRGLPGDKERTTAIDGVALYSGREGHRVRIGVGASFSEVDTRERKNFGPGVLEDNTVGVVDGTLTDVTGTPYVFMEDQERDYWYVSLQEEWSFARTWDLTAGIRYDRYSDFGGTFNPRIALVWATRENLTAKLLYGSAFRAPSLGQLHTINNPVRLGNPELDPETIETLELAFDYRPTKNLSTVLNLFRYDSEDLIDQVPDGDSTTRTEQNVIDQKGYGFEAEANWTPGEHFRLQSNFAWQRSEDKDTGVRVADAPGWQLFVAAHWEPVTSWFVGAQVNWVGARARPLEVMRPELDDYTLVNFSLRRKGIAGHLDLAVIGRNLFDEDARESSGPEIPDDYPLARRSVVLEMRYRF